jgi:hypothetical protein
MRNFTPCFTALLAFIALIGLLMLAGGIDYMAYVGG